MKIRLGVYGAGQLGLYLCQAARRLGVETVLLAERSDEPATFAADQVILQDTDHPERVDEFLAACDVVTFEREDVPVDILAKIAAAEAEGQLRCNPSAQTLAMFQDKGSQKDWMDRNNIPTLRYCLLEGTETDNAPLLAEFPLPFVQKARRGGYDGRGVQIVRTQEDLENLWPVPSVIELFLPQVEEISVVVARGVEGDIVSFPPFGLEFDDRFNSLDKVSVPARMPESRLRESIEVAERAIECLEAVGVFAVEMFVGENGEMLINEISARVHNSAHLTMEACEVSQFEQHVRAVLGQPLAPVGEVKPAVMLNLLYEDNLKESCPDEPVSRVNDMGATVHWYGKSTGSLGRKMGHITALGDDVSMAGELAEQSRGALRSVSGAAA